MDKEFVEICIKHGASKATIIDVDQIPFDKNLRSYCEMNYCGSFGNNYACPPEVGEAKELISKAKTYKRALVYQTITKIANSFDFEGMEKASKIHEGISDFINVDVVSNCDRYLELRAGKCKVCPECSVVDKEPCRYPDKKRASLEAYCMDVTTLAERCHMNYINGANTITFFGAILLD